MIKFSLLRLSLVVAGFSASATLPARAAEAHILALKNSPVVVGSKITTESSLFMRDGKVTLMSEGEKFTGQNESSSTQVVTLEALSPTRFRRIETKLEEKFHMELLGEILDEPKNGGPVTGLPVILERQEREDRYTATLEKGQATEEQEEELAKIAKEASARDDLVIYGETPRKLGEKWNVDVTRLSSFTGVSGLTGTMSLEFVEVRNVEGVACAILKNKYDLSGTTMEEEVGKGKMTIKGEDVICRSLVDYVNLDSQGKVRTITTTESEGEPMETSGTFSVSVRSMIVKPER
jgi:hypothetical protein